MHELRVVAAVELHVNVTYYGQHPALKPVYGKSQSVIRGKLFLFFRTVVELAQGIRGWTILEKIQTGGGWLRI